MAVHDQGQGLARWRDGTTAGARGHRPARLIPRPGGVRIRSTGNVYGNWFAESIGTSCRTCQGSGRQNPRRLPSAASRSRTRSGETCGSLPPWRDGAMARWRVRRQGTPDRDRDEHSRPRHARSAHARSRLSSRAGSGVERQRPEPKRTRRRRWRVRPFVGGLGWRRGSRRSRIDGPNSPALAVFVRCRAPDSGSGRGRGRGRRRSGWSRWQRVHRP